MIYNLFCLFFNFWRILLKKLLLSIILASFVIPALADDKPLTFNASLTSDYRYRGISQSRLNPALQGGVDYAFPNGFYVGAWGSTIKWIKDSGGSGNVEIDLYGGYRNKITEKLGYDVGVLNYQYPNHDLSVSPITTELYGALTYGPGTLKVSHSVSNLFGFSNSKNSDYVDLSANFDIKGGYTITPHIGHQWVKHNGSFNYTDYALTLSKSFGAWTPSVSLVSTDTSAYLAPNGKKLGKDAVVVSVKYNF